MESTLLEGDDVASAQCCCGRRRGVDAHRLRRTVRRVVARFLHRQYGGVHHVDRSFEHGG